MIEADKQKKGRFLALGMGLGLAFGAGVGTAIGAATGEFALRLSVGSAAAWASASPSAQL